MDWNLIPIASYVFFGLFVLASIVHLVFCYFEMERCRMATKCLTTLFLSIAATIALPGQPLVYLGCFLGCLGDAFLLKKHKVWPFVSGMVSFLAGHILYIIAMMRLCEPLHWGYYVATGLWIILFPIFGVHISKRIVHQKKLIFGGTMYFAFLFLDLIWSIILCSKGMVNFGLLCIFGSICFIGSDMFLTWTMFKRDVKRRDFYIMASYLLAQGLLVTGLVLTYLIR